MAALTGTVMVQQGRQQATRMTPTSKDNGNGKDDGSKDKGDDGKDDRRER